MCSFCLQQLRSCWCSTCTVLCLSVETSNFMLATIGGETTRDEMCFSYVSYYPRVAALGDTCISDDLGGGFNLAFCSAITAPQPRAAISYIPRIQVRVYERCVFRKTFWENFQSTVVQGFLMNTTIRDDGREAC